MRGSAGWASQAANAGMKATWTTLRPCNVNTWSPHPTWLQVFVPPHPLVKHWLAVARNAATPPQLFRSACAELGRILIYEAVREFLPTTQGVVDTPMGPSDVEFVDPRRPIKVSNLAAGWHQQRYQQQQQRQQCHLRHWQ